MNDFILLFFKMILESILESNRISHKYCEGLSLFDKLEIN